MFITLLCKLHGRGVRRQNTSRVGQRGKVRQQAGAEFACVALMKRDQSQEQVEVMI